MSAITLPAAAAGYVTAGLALADTIDQWADALDKGEYVSPDRLRTMARIFRKDAAPVTAAITDRDTEIESLRARVAELEATILNERGEGEAPGVGWEWSSGCWQNAKLGAMVARDGNAWLLMMNDGQSVWSVETARQGMQEAVMP